MKTKHLFWGFLFLTLGILILVNNFTSLDFYWLNIWHFWPLFLILFGISLLIKNETVRGIIISATAIVLGAAIFSSVKFGWGFFHNEVFNGRHHLEISDNDKDYKTKVFQENYSDNIKNASLYFKSSAGSFKISDTTNNLFYATTNGYDNYNLDRVDKEDYSKIKFENNGERFFLFKSKNRNRVNMSFSANPIWNMKFDVGAASTEFDLRNLKVENLDVDAGAASLKIFLGDLVNSAKVEINAGASSIEISIPDDVGCQVEGDIVLSKRDFRRF